MESQEYKYGAENEHKHLDAYSSEIFPHLRSEDFSGVKWKGWKHS